MGRKKIVASTCWRNLTPLSPHQRHLPCALFWRVVVFSEPCFLEPVVILWTQKMTPIREETNMGCKTLTLLQLKRPSETLMPNVNDSQSDMESQVLAYVDHDEPIKVYKPFVSASPLGTQTIGQRPVGL